MKDDSNTSLSSYQILMLVGFGLFLLWIVVADIREDERKRTRAEILAPVTDQILREAGWSEERIRESREAQKSMYGN